jgi:ligand-binding sensor domain-containing protein
MNRYLFLTLSLLYLLPYSSFSQEYSYTRYDVKDGLAGSNVFCITQDKQGFLWMGTDAGVSRFDGTHFRNFTLQDGLPDIEVLHIFADSKGRVWMSPFRKSICFYYEGKIHNQENDTLLRRIRIQALIEDFAEDKDGNILVQEHTLLHLVAPDGRVRQIDAVNGKPLRSVAMSRSSDGHFLVQTEQEVYHFSENGFSLFTHIGYTSDFTNSIAINTNLMAWEFPYGSYRFLSTKTGKWVDFGSDSFNKKHISLSLVGDSLIYRNGSSGVLEYNIFTGGIRSFSLGARISRTFRDDEGNTWFTSLGQGLFRLNSDDIRNIPLAAKNNVRSIALTIRKADHELLVGGSYSMVFRFALPSFRDAGSYKAVSSDLDEVYYLEKMKDGHLIIGTTVKIFTDSVFTGDKFPEFSVRSACLKNDSEVLAGGHLGVYLFDAKTFRAKDTLFRQRATVVYYKNETLYIGTINGLYVKEPGKPIEYWGERDSLLTRRISSVVLSGDSTLWVATYGGGIIAFRNGRRTARLSLATGLSSDLCRTLQVHNNTLWVGTDKGLNKVDIDHPGNPITMYTANDGLGSNIINTIYADSSMVYVGTPAGLSFFDVGKAGVSSGCRLDLLGIISSGRSRLTDTPSLRLDYRENDIRFDFVGISYKSGGDISYRYRLQGLDSTWKKTKETFLEYPTLPSGDYELQLQAVNKFGIASRLLSIRFTVITPFWNTLWFEVALVLILVAVTWLFASQRIRRIRRRQTEKEELNRRLAETEHMALQSQMNPHFIFNCLNSIQQYVFDQDIFVANKYITGFAKLIRATLHNSTKPFISLADEIDYLSAYLSLEKLRFKDKMNYSIQVEPSLNGDLEEISIPPMMIQPYVENSMRHGLRHKVGGQGYIRINVMQESDKLAVIIEDNGIGREQAARYKTKEHIEYQSRGMSLTADRIRLINTVNGGNIRVEVLDIKDQDGGAAGTRVIVKFPRYDLSLIKNSI